MTPLALLLLLAIGFQRPEVEPPTSQPDDAAASQPVDEAPPAPPPPTATPLRAGAKPVRLFIRPGELDRIRDRCGIGAAPPPGGTLSEVGSRAREFQQLSAYVQQTLRTAPGPSGLYPVAFMHLIAGQPGVADAYTRTIEQALSARESFAFESDDAVTALDWCWRALSADVRQRAAGRLVEALQPLQATDNPFEHALFHPKLCSLAAAIALRDAYPPGCPEAERIEETYSAGRAYMNDTFAPIVVQLGGMCPTPAARAAFEGDAVFAMELWQSIEPTAWAAVRGAMQRALDVYLWTDTQWPALRCGLMHDTGSSSPLTPGTGDGAFAPAVADILARRTAGGVPAYFATRRSTDGIRTPVEAQRAWLRIVHASAEARPIEPARAPLARTLGNGWVAMRSDWRPGATLIAFDAGQPYWHSRQHLDAGQFQIIRKGRLAIDSGEDVFVEATRARGGDQRHGEQPGEFDLYARSTLAHNCVVVTRPNEPQQRIGRAWVVQGNQRQPDIRPADRGSADAPIDRATGRLIAFETNAFYSLAVADLAKAYGVKSVLVYERALLFLHDGLLIVIDRLETAAPKMGRYWMLQLPNAPTIGGEPLDAGLRRRAEGAAAGSWVYPPMDGWLSTQADEGRLFVRSVLPVQRRWHVIGGPQKWQQIERGPSKGRNYVGSSAKGFEYWLAPAAVAGGMNAWFRLGEPTSLGDAFGAGCGWGRLEVEATSESTSTVFVHLLAPCDRAQERPPVVTVKSAGDGTELGVSLGRRQYVVRLAPGELPLGQVTVKDESGKRVFERRLAGEVVEPPPSME